MSIPLKCNDDDDDDDDDYDDDNNNNNNNFNQFNMFREIISPTIRNTRRAFRSVFRKQLVLPRIL